MTNLIIKKVQPIMKMVKNEPIKDLPFEEFWRTWDKLMDKEMFIQANIFLVRRYNNRWNRGLD